MMIIRLLVVANVMPFSGNKQKNVNVDTPLAFEGLLNSLKEFEEGS